MSKTKRQNQKNIIWCKNTYDKKSQINYLKHKYKALRSYHERFWRRNAAAYAAANQMQNKMKRSKKTLFNGSLKGLLMVAVMVKVNGDNLVLSVQINAEVLNADDKEMLEEMVMTATNEAIKSAKDTSQAEMQKSPVV